MLIFTILLCPLLFLRILFLLSKLVEISQPTELGARCLLCIHIETLATLPLKSDGHISLFFLYYLSQKLFFPHYFSWNCNIYGKSTLNLPCLHWSLHATPLCFSVAEILGLNRPWKLCLYLMSILISEAGEQTLSCSSPWTEQWHLVAGMAEK